MAQAHPDHPTPALPCARAAAVAGTLALAAAVAAPLGGQEVAAADSAAAAALPEAEATGLPVIFTVGLGYGQRNDPCAYCASPDNTESFTGHVSIGKKLAYGFGVGVDASVWRRGHPGPPGAPDSAGVAVPTSLTNTLGNASLTFSWQLWRIYLRAGGGVAWGAQDVQGTDGDGETTVARASGMGIGYSVGGGLALPVAHPVAIAFFANYNVGRYDLASPAQVLQRDARHEYLELGIGVTLR